MGRRLPSHDYSRPGFYHITITVADGLGHPLGAVVGADADSAAVALTPVGAAVAHELTTAITAHYPMITLDAYVIMPEHLHFILVVRAPIVSKGGRSAHLGQVIAGFKKGCNRAFWAATGQQAPVAATPSPVPALTAAPVPAAAIPVIPAGKPLGAMSAAALVPTPVTATAPAPVPAPASAPAPAAASTAPGGSPAGFRPPSSGSSGRPPLFSPGYCDVMPIEAGQLETQRAYIRNNPRSRWLRSHDSARLQPQRGGIDTALTVAALRGFLKRECPPSLATPDALAVIERRLLLEDGRITCDSYGDRTLLQCRLLPVVSHRKDAPRLEEQKARCLTAATQGAVLVSARIAKGEQTIIDEASHRGFPVVLITDNGFPSVYHPSADRIASCAEGRLLLLTPWQYEYRGKNEAVTVPFCKTMNCVAQALCRTRDSWWKE